MRDRLVELIKDIVVPFFAEAIADSLLANGVIAPLCKIGEAVCFVNCLDEIIDVGQVYDIRYNGNTCIYRVFRSEEGGDVFAFADFEIGKSVFLTREEAEQALKGEHHAKIH